MKGLAVWMSSPDSIFRVANTPRPADSVSKTWIGGGEGVLGFELCRLSVGMVVEKTREDRSWLVRGKYRCAKCLD